MYNIKKGGGGPARKYAPSFMRKVVGELLSGSIIQADLARKYGISPMTVKRWLVWYEKDQQLLPSIPMDEEEKKAPCKETGSEAVDIKALQEELARANLKVICLETLIDLAEKDLKIDIRKNGGTRSPLK